MFAWRMSVPGDHVYKWPWHTYRYVIVFEVCATIVWHVFGWLIYMSCMMSNDDLDLWLNVWDMSWTIDLTVIENLDIDMMSNVLTWPLIICLDDYDIWA